MVNGCVHGTLKKTKFYSVPFYFNIPSHANSQIEAMLLKNEQQKLYKVYELQFYEEKKHKTEKGSACSESFIGGSLSIDKLIEEGAPWLKTLLMFGKNRRRTKSR